MRVEKWTSKRLVLFLIPVASNGELYNTFFTRVVLVAVKLVEELFRPFY